MGEWRQRIRPGSGTDGRIGQPVVFRLADIVFYEFRIREEGIMAREKSAKFAKVENKRGRHTTKRANCLGSHRGTKTQRETREIKG